MTQKEFCNINISTVKEKRNIKYKLCDGVLIEFKQYKVKEKEKFRLLLNGHEISYDNNYSNYAIKNSFLFVANEYNLHSYQLYPLADGKTYMIPKDVKLPSKINWNDVLILE